MNERRGQDDRRNFAVKRGASRSDKCNRRTSPDRRLNNIEAEWVPFSYIQENPVTRSVFIKG